MLFNPLKNLVTFFKKSERGMTKSTNTSSQFCKPLVGLCALLCMSLWISAAQAQQMRTALAQINAIPASYTDSNSDVVTATLGVTGDILDSSASGHPAFNDTDLNADDSNVGLVDWVEVQIRLVDEGTLPSAATARPANTDNVYIKPAWLLSDGSVVDVDSDIAAINGGTEGELTIPTGTDGLTFDETTHDLYVLVNHRNHLPIMSASAVAASTVAADGGAYVHNFTEADQAFPNTAKEVGGRHFMFAGDSIGFGAINISDVNTATFGAVDGGQFGSAGYLSGDYNLSGNVNITDVNIVTFGSADTPSGNFGTGSPIAY